MEDALMSKEYSVAQDLKETQAFVESLEGYLQQDQLYGSAGGGFFTGGRMPALTVGSLAMRLRRLQALEGLLTAEQRMQLADLRKKHDAIRKQWYAHYKAKLEKEIKSRLDAMRPFFEEAQTDPQLAAKVYGPEVVRRTIAEEAIMALAEMNEDVGDLTRKARAADAALRRYVQPSEFVWHPQLEAAYPRDRFWWMYVAPPVPVN
jgi:hypothetical protein